MVETNDPSTFQPVFCGCLADVLVDVTFRLSLIVLFSCTAQGKVIQVRCNESHFLTLQITILHPHHTTPIRHLLPMGTSYLDILTWALPASHLGLPMFHRTGSKFTSPVACCCYSCQCCANWGPHTPGSMQHRSAGYTHWPGSSLLEHLLHNWQDGGSVFWSGEDRLGLSSLRCDSE